MQLTPPLPSQWLQPCSSTSYYRVMRGTLTLKTPSHTIKSSHIIGLALAFVKVFIKGIVRNTELRVVQNYTKYKKSTIHSWIKTHTMMLVDPFMSSLKGLPSSIEPDLTGEVWSLLITLEVPHTHQKIIQCTYV